MTEMIIVLKLDLDIESIAKHSDDNPDHIKAKVRAYIANIVGHNLSQPGHVKLLSSALAEETETYDTVSGHRLLRIVETCRIQDRETGDML